MKVQILAKLYLLYCAVLMTFVLMPLLFHHELFMQIGKMGGVLIIIPHLFSIYFAVRLIKDDSYVYVRAIRVIMGLGVVYGLAFIHIDVFTQASVIRSGFFLPKVLFLAGLPTFWFGMFSNPKYKSNTKPNNELK